MLDYSTYLMHVIAYLMHVVAYLIHVCDIVVVMMCDFLVRMLV